jgi:hypothetical protein
MQASETTETEDDPIRDAIVRLARPHPQGAVIERAAILAEGAASTAIVEWILAHEGEPEAVAVPQSRRGLHGSHDTAPRTTLRYVLPAAALAG